MTPFYKTPAADHLGTVNKECTNLNEEKRKLFKSEIAKLLWVSKKARPVLGFRCG